MKGENSTS